MQLDKIYFEVKTYIGKLNFSKLWKGFKPLKFALYTDSECFFDGKFIPKTGEFLANTCIVYNGERIAIWYLQEEIDAIVLASKIVHEMFHGFQSMHAKFDSEYEIDALYNYKYSDKNLNLKLKENNLLCSLSEQFEENVFSELLKIRKYRCDNFPYEYNYEARVEQIEGSAEYVELMCLEQLSKPLFEKRLLSIRQRIVSANNLLPVRICCYDIGALLLFILIQNNIEFDTSFASHSFFENLLQDVCKTECVSGFDTQNDIKEFFRKAELTIEGALLKNDVVCDVSCDILGVNVYNAVCVKNHIISQFFVMYGSLDNPKVEMGNFVIETNAYKKLTKIYRI